MHCGTVAWPWTSRSVIDPAGLGCIASNTERAFGCLKASSPHRVLGPFGEVVTYGDGLTYLTWYPVCLQGISHDLAPPDWPTYPAQPLRSQLLNGTLNAMAELVPSLRGLDSAELENVIAAVEAVMYEATGDREA